MFWIFKQYVCPFDYLKENEQTYMFHVYQRAFPALGRQVGALNHKEKDLNVCYSNDIKYWNKILKEVMESSLKTFKIRLDKYLFSVSCP